MTLYIAAGAVLAFGGLLFVLLPLFSPASGAAPGAARAAFRGALRRGSVDDAGAGPAGSAIDILREIEFDRATGKLSDSDYHDLKVAYTGPALAELRRRDSGHAGNVGNVGDAGDPGRSEERSGRPPAATSTAGVTACPTCGPRPEGDAQYCSSCARYLPGACAQCGASVTEPAAQFCSGCGQRLAA